MARNPRWLLIFLLLLVLPGCAPAMPVTGSSSGDLLASIQQRGTLVIAAETDFPPQSQLVEDAQRAENTRCEQTAYTANQLTGFDIDVAVEISRRLGVEPCFVTPAWSQLIAGNWAGLWDISVGSMVITPERMEKLYFTQPYTSGAAVLFVHKDNSVYKEIGDLSEKRIGVCAGCAYESYLRGNLVIPGQTIQYAIQNAQVFGYDTDTSALADLARGDGLELDAVITDPDTGLAAIQDGLPIKQLGEPIYRDFVAAAIDKKSSSDSLPLARRVSEIIQEMHRDGKLKELSIHYYGADFTTPAASFDIHALGQLP